MTQGKTKTRKGEVDPNNLHREVSETVSEDYLMGLAISATRRSKNLTQEDLANLVGVQKARISCIEQGANVTISTIRRVFGAMGVSVTIDMGEHGSIKLC